MASPARQKNVFRFGLFEAHPASGELLKQGQQVRLQDQPFRMLVLLLERPGEVVTRDELREKLWPEQTFVEFDNGLNVAVKKVRDALGDSAENPRFVETVPRHGYRFIAPVSCQMLDVIAGSAIAPPAEMATEPGAQTQPGPVAAVRGPKWRKRILAACVLLLLMAGAAIFMIKRTVSRKAGGDAGNKDPAPTAAARKTVAVMEFQNLSGQKADAWFSTAIPEMLTTELGAGETLRLVPAEDVARMKRELRLATSSNLSREMAVVAGKNLHADMLVLGSYTAIGSGPARRLRVDVRLQDTAAGEIVAEVAETGSEQRLFELVGGAGTRLREALGAPGMSPSEEAAARAALPANAVAARLYAEGLARLRVVDAAGARDLLQQSIAAESKFPLSHMALASTWRALGYDQKARSEAKKAFDLASGLPRADRLLIEGRYHEMSGEMDQAISAYRALFTLFPDSLEDGLILAEAETWGGKPADALATLDALRRLPAPLSRDPRIDLRQAAAFGSMGQPGGFVFILSAEEKARNQGAPLLLAKAQTMECLALIGSSQFEEAAQACQAAQRAFAAAGNPLDTAQNLRSLGDVRQHQGRLADALDLYQQALKIDQEGKNDRGIAVSVNEMALVYEGRGELRQAERLYRQSYGLFLKVGHRKNAGVLANNVGGVLLQEGKLAEAERMFQQSMNLARETGSKDAEAGAHSAMAELNLERGNLESARRQAEDALALGQEGKTFGHAEPLSRLGRILAAQGDLAGARQRQDDALSIAEAIGASGLGAEIRAALATLDLEGGRPAQAEQSLRTALAVFRKEKMTDDELQTVFVLSRCLLAQGKIEESRIALKESREAAARSQNPGVRLLFEIAAARAQVAGTASGSVARRNAHSQLRSAAGRAGRLGLLPIEYEAWLARGENEIHDDRAAGEQTLESLEKNARGRGFELIARNAAGLRTRQP
jgi:DNA-binding winged helix-turn-helix (wHTH) protein/tetratricopeptide (TPR) repeat protein